MHHRSHDREGLCPHRDPPYGNERAVRILLECILVCSSIQAVLFDYMNLFIFTESEFHVVNKVLTVLGFVAKHIPDSDIEAISRKFSF